MKIRGNELDVNIFEELYNFQWENEQIRGNKFQACSPFRNEKRPSFAVNLDTGIWKDSGAVDMKFLKGNFISLLALLRNEDYQTIEDYLIERYSTILADTSNLKLSMNLSMVDTNPKYIDRKSLKHIYIQKNDYLTSRGISGEIQTLFETGFNPETNSIALVWTDLKGRVINVKYRRVNTKSFYYEKGGQPVKNFVYGLYQCKKIKAKRVFICESEIDALTLWTQGQPAIAVGGSSLSYNQENLIISVGIKELVIATDNDAVGHRFRQFLKEKFAGYLTVLDLAFPAGKKDINELEKNQLAYVIAAIRTMPISFL